MVQIRHILCLFVSVTLGLAAAAQAQTPNVLHAAQIQVAEGHYATAAKSLEAVGLETLSPQGAHLLGRCYQAMLQHERAIDAFERADTSMATVLADWGRSLERLGLPEEAEARYRAAFRKDSTNQTVAASLARLLADRTAWSEVAAIYERLVEEDLFNSYLHAQLGTAYTRLDSTERAIAHYERAHLLNPRNIKVVLALTKIYYDIEYIMSARQVLARALDERPRHPALWRRTGEFAFKEETYRDAVEAFSNVLRYSPDSTAQDLSHLGVSLYLTNEFTEALDYLQQSFDRNDGDVMNTFYLGMAYQRLGQYEEALFYLHLAADLLGEGMLADIEARIGNTYEQTEQQPEAIRAYRLALNLDASRLEASFHLAALYDAYYADKKAALDQYQHFLERVEEGQLPKMQQYAEQRVQEISENKFFEQGRVPKPSSLDTLVIKPDSSGSKDQ